MATTEPLSEQEQKALDQMRRAQEQGSTLKQLAPTMGLGVHQLYQLRRSLVRKGAFSPLPRRKVRVLDRQRWQRVFLTKHERAV